jgi:glycerol-3-phosphate acyltransferase PlsX
MNQIRVALDAMGGDFAPSVIVEGALEALKEYSCKIILVGDTAKINSLLKGKIYPEELIDIYPAEEVIAMDASPAISVRRKPNSSINVGLALVKDKKADVFISAGNTGAVVCAAILKLRLIPGIERPGIAIVFPTLKGESLLIDAGANIDPKPLHLLQYGIMAEAYASTVLHKSSVSAGLLNIGEEETKGSEFMRETHRLLNDSNLHFIGNVEGKELFKGDCDVIIADGVVGNVALKVSESFAHACIELMRRYIKSNLLSRIGALFMLPAIKKLKKDIDYAEYGAAPLLGVDGLCFISHGSSSAKAIKNAIKVSACAVENRINDKIKMRVDSFIKSSKIPDN